MSGAYREIRTLGTATVDQMMAAADDLDVQAWAAPVIDAMNEAMSAVAKRMIADGRLPKPGAFTFSVVFEAESEVPS